VITEGGPERDYQSEADEILAKATDGLSPDESALLLIVLVNRAATRLHNLARAEAAARKGAADWPSWAALQNATRAIVLQASSARDLAAKVVGRRR
jgi:hypothetical protein